MLSGFLIDRNNGCTALKGWFEDKISPNLGLRICNLRLQTSDLGFQISKLRSQIGNLGLQIDNLKSQTGDLGLRIGNLKSQIGNLGLQIGREKIHFSPFTPQHLRFSTCRGSHYAILARPFS